MKTTDTCKTKPNVTKVRFWLPSTLSDQEKDWAYSSASRTHTGH